MLVSTRVVVVTSQKGGSGKTTLSGHIAVEAERNGHVPVALVDADPQGSLASWWNARTAETPLFVKTEVSRLYTDLQTLRAGGMRLVIIDTPPAVTGTIRSVVAFADLVIIPTRPSPHDLRAVAATLDIVEAKDKPFVFVINDATPRARITSEAAVALSQHGTVAPVTIHHRTDFASSMIDGRTVMECHSGCKSAQEIAELWTYLAARLAKLRPKASVVPAAGAVRPVFRRQETPGPAPEPAPAAAPPVETSGEPGEAPDAARGEGSADDLPYGRPEPAAAEPPRPSPAPTTDRPDLGRREQSPAPPSSTATGFGRRVAGPRR